jgi:hypothetical protein
MIPRDDPRHEPPSGAAPRDPVPWTGASSGQADPDPWTMNAPAGQEDNWDDAERVGGWRLLFALIFLTALGFGGWWAMRQAQQQGWLDQFHRAYGDVSLLPGTLARPSDPALEIQVYYVAPNGRALDWRVYKLRRAPANDAERVDLACQAIAAGAGADRQCPPLPPNVKLRGAYVLDGIVWIDLSKEFLQPENPTPLGERLTIYALIDTFLLNVPDLQGARLLVDGQPVRTAWGWMDLSSPIGVNLSLIG